MYAMHKMMIFYSHLSGNSISRRNSIFLIIFYRIQISINIHSLVLII